MQKKNLFMFLDAFSESLTFPVSQTQGVNRARPAGTSLLGLAGIRIKSLNSGLKIWVFFLISASSVMSERCFDDSSLPS